MNRPPISLLLILDGFGVAPKSDGNAITEAHMPTFRDLITRYPTMTLRASGDEVGLSWGEVGNSEVGHLAIGAGRVYYQTFPRINHSIESGAFFENTTLKAACTDVKEKKGRLHLVGLVSAGNVHASDKHLHALLKLAAAEKVKEVVIHVILDGRDTLYNAGVDFVNTLTHVIDETGVGRIASVSGRYYAMDRDHRFERTEKAFRAIVLHEGTRFDDPLSAMKASYVESVFDEEFVPVVIGEEAPVDPTKDTMLFFNFRPDRMRQLVHSVVDETFTGFDRGINLTGLSVITMAEVEAGLPVSVIFPPEIIAHTLAEELSLAGLKQLHIAETEKYAHVTFFLNGTREEPFAGEDRILIPSPKVASYDLAPEMSAEAVAQAALKAIRDQTHDVIIVNIANPDMVGHTGDLQATIKALEVTDRVIRLLSEAILERGGLFLLTADHGNAEELKNVRTGEIDKEHATNPVPFMIVHPSLEGQIGPSGEVIDGDLSLLPPVGILADVAPTLLFLLSIPQPPDMTGQPLWMTPLS